MTRFEKWSVLSTSLGTAVTGAAYFWMKYMMEPTEPWAVINHPLQPWVLKAHILVSPLLLFAVGLIATRHIWRHFRSGRLWGRRSGLTAAISLAPMVLTGYLIQAITGEPWLTAMAVSHIAFGFLYSVVIAIHAVIAARRPDLPEHPGDFRRTRLRLKLGTGRTFPLGRSV